MGFNSGFPGLIGSYKRAFSVAVSLL